MKFKLEPYQLQREIFERSKDLASFALFAQMGTGKTKMTLDTAYYLYKEGRIDCVIIICPNAVKANWVYSEVDKNIFEDDVGECIVYTNNKSKTLIYRNSFSRIIGSEKLSFFAINYEASITKMGKESILKLLNSKKCMMILDESTYIKTPGSKRTKSIRSFGKKALYRRILTGTPYTNSAFDIYSQMAFLESGMWKEYSLENFLSFKQYFGVFETMYSQDRQYELLVEHKNLDKLIEIIEPRSARVLKTDMVDLPEKTYIRRSFTLTKEQQEIYQSAKQELVTELSNGEMITHREAIVKLSKLQQITSGFIYTDQRNPKAISPQNPRLELLKSVLGEIDSRSQVIIWAKFRYDIDIIIDELGKENCSRYDGAVNAEDRDRYLTDFTSGNIRYFVGNPAVGGMGINLVNSSYSLHYNSTYSLETRLQCESRCDRIGQTEPITYIDLVAKNTVDTHIIDKLIRKKELQDYLLNDEILSWIT